MAEQRFVTGSREQAFLLPPDMSEWLPADHLVWLVCEAVDAALAGGEQTALRGLVAAEVADPALRAERFAQAARQLAEPAPVGEQPRRARPPAADAAAPRAPRRANKTDPESRMMLSPR